MSLSEEDKIKSNLISLFELCSDTVGWLSHKKVKLSVSSSILNLAIITLKNMSTDSFLKEIIERSYPYWEDIRLRKESFLLDKISVLFSELPLQYRDDICYIFTLKNDDGSYMVKNEIRDDFWKILCGTVKCILRYIHQGRVPKIDSSGKEKYTREFYPNIKIKDHMTLFFA